MTVHQTKLRLARDTDLMFFFNLKNEVTVLESSFDMKPVPLETHTDWFTKKLKDENCYLFVIESNGISIGQVRVDVFKDVGRFNVAVVPAYRGMDYASWGIKRAARRVFSRRQEVQRMQALIKPWNLGSTKSFARAGFIYRNSIIHNKQKCIEMVLEREKS